MRYVPYHRLGDAPNIVVDGYGNASTVLTLSHWPGSATPGDLKDDLSTQIAFRYLDKARPVAADAVTNNHYDEDGLCGIYAVLNTDDAQRRRDRLIDVASAGDFGVYRDADSARIAFALMAYADADRSPLAAQLHTGYHEQTAILYEELLGTLPQLIDDPHHFRDLWEAEDADLQRTYQQIDAHEITIEEQPDIDLAVVTAPAGPKPHEYAINNRTRRMRILTMQPHRYELRYRYETWVVYVSEPVAPRVDLAALVERLNADDPGWGFDGVDDITPRLKRDGESALPPDGFTAEVERFLRQQ